MSRTQHGSAVCSEKDWSDYVAPPIRILPDGRGVWIDPLTYGRARLNVGQVGSPVYDDGW